MKRSLAPLLALVLAAACNRSPSGPVRPEPAYNILFLGAPSGALSFTPTGVDLRRVVGYAEFGGQTRAVLWQGGAFDEIGPRPPAGCSSEALAVSAGYVVGAVRCANDVYGWSYPDDLGRADARPYELRDVNASGVVAGTLYPAPFGEARRRAFVRERGALRELLPPGATASEAVGIANDGSVAVNAFSACDSVVCAEHRVFLLREGEWLEVPRPGSSPRRGATAVSSDGRVAGRVEAGEPFIWRPRRRVTAMSVIPGTQVDVRGVNERGLVVGTARTEASLARPDRAVAWGGGRQYLLTERLQAGSPWQVEAAVGIDDEGDIAATGTDTSSGRKGAILLTPPPEQ
ncbi:hypothetical protein [Longimicrobium terrae]|uniref:Uncharacterized protein n=1 Tax=Longimicrobium terrae TaxID=1639882 RepID=A0A841GZF7_9BACT|nr:hypothetical protein [Longimicrobium terrae]MBB4636850.1 hypothetical protein [Longimicrobium terrae]MBB6071150.1 hypothetical protein [Longimicrobium terrae]NNC29199.1 hypothetical protein [Longimicrobium terrae]